MKKKKKKKYKSAWEEILDYHERNSGGHGDYIYTEFPIGWKKPKKPPRRWNEPGNY